MDVVDPFKVEIVEPSDSISDQLIRTEIDFEAEIPLSDTVTKAIAQVIQRIQESNENVIDIIGTQMDALQAEFDECLSDTKNLFSALGKLMQSQQQKVKEKVNSTTSLIRNIEMTMGCVRKISGEK